MSARPLFVLVALAVHPYRAESRVLARPGGRRYVKQFARAVALKLTGASG